MTKILKKNKIASRDEYDYVIDKIVPMQQEGFLTKKEQVKLNELIDKFENNPSN